MWIHNTDLHFNHINHIINVTIIIVMTSITVSNEVKQELKKIGHKGESYNDILNRLITYYCTKKLDLELNDILENEEFTPLILDKI